jgi:hypothetical protein
MISYIYSYIYIYLKSILNYSNAHDLHCIFFLCVYISAISLWIIILVLKNMILIDLEKL